MRTPFTLALAAALAAPGAAHACGGFFCNPNQPVDQKGEEILFAVDEAAGEIEMHVRIEYEGPSDEFAWILPAPADPELAIGADAVFPVLSQLRAQFFLNRDLGECAVPLAGATSSVDYEGTAGVEVIRSGAVGPYDTVTLQASSADALLDWLQSNGYDLPPGLDPVLQPYLAQDAYFVALKLQKDKDTGDIEPIVLRYPGDMASIPIQLTSIAATPDMRLRVYVLGEHRAVPSSYLHVRLNHLAIDWWNGGSNLEDAITRAADEAGGHAFFTDYAGPPDSLVGQVFRPEWDQVDWAALPDAYALLSEVAGRGLQLDDPLLGLLADHLGLPEQGAPGLDLVDAVSCLQGLTMGDPECWRADLEAIAYDPAALADDLEAIYLEPRRRVDRLLASYPKITRLTSSVSPVEMTVDPTFVFNPDMPDVDVNRFADEVWFCGMNGDFADAPRELHLADGRVVRLPSMNQLAQWGMTEFEWLDSKGLTVPVAAWIERTGPSGDPEVVVDNRPLLDAQLADQDAEGRGCGCNSATPAPAWLALLPVGLLARRRR